MDPLSPPTNWVTHSRWRKAREAIGSSRSRRRIAIIFYAKPLFRRPIIPDLIPVWRQAMRSRASSKRPGQKAETRKRHAAPTMRRRRSSDDQAGEVDIDDRRKAEGAIRESEYKLRQIIDTVPSLVWATGLNGENTYANQRILDYIGARYEDFKNHGWQRFVHPDDLPETLKAFHYAIETGTSYETVHRVRRADGEFRWHRTRGEAMRDREGRIIQWYGLTIDVDEAKKAEERLRRGEAYLAEAQHLSHTGSFGWTPSTGDFHWSDETFRI